MTFLARRALWPSTGLHSSEHTTDLPGWVSLEHAVHCFKNKKFLTPRFRALQESPQLCFSGTLKIVRGLLLPVLSLEASGLLTHQELVPTPHSLSVGPRVPPYLGLHITHSEIFGAGRSPSAVSTGEYASVSQHIYTTGMASGTTIPYPFSVLRGIRGASVTDHSTSWKLRRRGSQVTFPKVTQA